MKVTIVTDQSGEIVGTARAVETGDPATGTGGPVAGPEQASQVIDLPSDLESIENPEDFRRRLQDYVRRR